MQIILLLLYNIEYQIGVELKHEKIECKEQNFVLQQNGFGRNYFHAFRKPALL